MIRLGALLAVALLIFLTTPVAASADSAVELRPNPVDSDGWITLGDLFYADGAAGRVRLAAGPGPGRAATLDAAWVQAVARQAGLAWTNASGLKRLVVMGVAPTAPTAAVAGGEVQALTYARNLAAGDLLGPMDVVWAPVQRHVAPADAPQDVDRIIGKAARRPVRQGAAVASGDLMAARVIRKDDLVEVLYRYEGVNLTLQGKAVSDAAVGDRLAVLNTQSKKTIEAVALAPGKALAGPEAETVAAQAAQSR